jgi:WD40 repeat protein
MRTNLNLMASFIVSALVVFILPSYSSAHSRNTGTLHCEDFVDATKWGELARFEPGERGRSANVIWSPDGMRLAASYTNDGIDGAILIWDIDEGKIEWEKEQPFSVFRMAWSPVDNSSLAVLGWNGKLDVWDVNNPNSSPLEISAPELGEIVWSPDGTQIALLGDEIHIFDIISSQEVKPLNNSAHGTVLSVMWTSNDLEWVSQAQDKTVNLWSLSTTKPVFTWNEVNDSQSVFLSPTGAMVVALDETAQVLKMNDRSVLATLDGVGGRIAWSPNEACLASANVGFLPGYSETGIKLWDVATGERIATLEGHLGEISSLAWSPDNTRLASAGADGTVRIWGRP